MKKNLFYLLCFMILSLAFVACEKENPTPIPAQTQEPIPTTIEYKLDESNSDKNASPEPPEKEVHGSVTSPVKESL